MRRSRTSQLKTFFRLQFTIQHLLIQILFILTLHVYAHLLHNLKALRRRQLQFLITGIKRGQNIGVFGIIRSQAIVIVVIVQVSGRSQIGKVYTGRNILLIVHGFHQSQLAGLIQCQIRRKPRPIIMDQPAIACLFWVV